MKKYIVQGADSPNVAILWERHPLHGKVRITHFVAVRYTDGTYATVREKRLKLMPNQEDVEPSELDRTYEFLFT